MISYELEITVQHVKRQVHNGNFYHFFYIITYTAKGKNGYMVIWLLWNVYMVIIIYFNFMIVIAAINWIRTDFFLLLIKYGVYNCYPMFCRNLSPSWCLVTPCLLCRLNLEAPCIILFNKLNILFSHFISLLTLLKVINWYFIIFCNLLNTLNIFVVASCMQWYVILFYLSFCTICSFGIYYAIFRKIGN